MGWGRRAVVRSRGGGNKCQAHIFLPLCISFLIKEKTSVKSGKRKVEGEQIIVLPESSVN